MESSGLAHGRTKGRPPLMPGHPIARVLESFVEVWYHSIASPYATQRRKQRDNLIGETLESAKKPEKTEGETW